MRAGFITNTPFEAAGDITLTSGGNILADSHFAAGGNFSILSLAGEAGNVVSLYDPIISAEGDVIFGDYTGVSLKVEASGYNNIRRRYCYNRSRYDFIRLLRPRRGNFG